MKKYALFFLVLVFVFGSFAVIDPNIAKANNCSYGDLFDSNTGLSCYAFTQYSRDCAVGDLYSGTTGRSCVDLNANFVNPAVYSVDEQSRIQPSLPPAPVAVPARIRPSLPPVSNVPSITCDDKGAKNYGGFLPCIYSDSIVATMGTPSYAKVPDSNGNITQVTYSIPMDVTAYHQTWYMGQTVQKNTFVSSPNAFAYVLQDSANPLQDLTTGISSATLSSYDAAIEGGWYRLDNGQTKHFIMQIILTTPPIPGHSYRVAFKAIKVFPSLILTGSPRNAYDQMLLPAENYQTGYQYITNATQYIPIPTATTSCNASIYWGDSPYYPQTTVPYGGSAKETWSVQGADQVWADCGDGPKQISTGPQSYTFNNLVNNRTCRVWGVIGADTNACSASATIYVNR